MNINEFLVLAWIGVIATCFVLMVVALFGMHRSMRSMAKAVKPGVSVWGHLGGNVFNVVLRPSLLTEEGIRKRQRLLYWASCFALSLVAMAFLSSVLP